jgi:hypothetical protein
MPGSLEAEILAEVEALLERIDVRVEDEGFGVAQGRISLRPAPHTGRPGSKPEIEPCHPDSRPESMAGALPEWQFDRATQARIGPGWACKASAQGLLFVAAGLPVPLSPIQCWFPAES